MDRVFKEGEWNFINMNSPADLFCRYRTDSSVCLEEYDRCRNGHLLLSAFFADTHACRFEADVLEAEDGAGIGLYYGDGCFDRYILVAVRKGNIEVRVPNGVPLGDTFRYDGAKRYYTAADVTWDGDLPCRIGFTSGQEGFCVYCNGKQVVKNLDLKVPWKKRAARVMVMAVNDSGIRPKTSAVIGGYEIDGILSGKRLTGVCLSEAGKPQNGIWLHIAGLHHAGCMTDEEGRFDLGCLPEDTYEIVAGGEEKGFGHFPVVHTGETCCWYPDLHWQPDSREAIPQRELKNDLCLESLNGIWKFAMDLQETGEEEQWFLPGSHQFDSYIRIPGSWQSLRAFGEEFLADEYSLHQASTFRCNWREHGRTAWMQRTFVLKEAKRIQLVLGAVSGIAAVWLDGTKVGCSTDFYSSSRFDLGELKEGTYTLTIRVRYPFEGRQCCLGKQGFWFTDSPGIWQNVWLEEKQVITIEDLLIDQYEIEEDRGLLRGRAMLELLPDSGSMQELLRHPDSMQELMVESGQEQVLLKGRFRQGAVYRLDFIYRAHGGTANADIILGDDGVSVCFDATLEDAYDCRTIYISNRNDSRFLTVKRMGGTFELLRASAGEVLLQGHVELNLDDRSVATATFSLNEKDGTVEAAFELPLHDVRKWSPADPVSYSLKAAVKIGDTTLGRYERRAAFRFMGQMTAEGGTSYVTVNGEAVYLRGVLDQGYNPWGLYTYPSLRKEEKGSILYDVRAAKECGYNMIRMHIKDNDPDWYDICDEEGVLVWDEVPSCFYGTWEDSLWRGLHLRRLKAMCKKHNYHPSVVICSVFNESWGILGDHERSPWEISGAQEWIKRAAVFYKTMNPSALVIDNSGYGKTGETDILDYHSYPLTYEDAFSFFQRLEQQNYPGSVFNCYHEANRQLMQRDEVRDLLQRNCAIPLQSAAFTGREVQKGQPVLISEFLHTNDVESLVRIFKFGGYMRMNLASQENEDTSPLTSTRTWRAFGYLHRDLSPAGYEVVNRENYVFLGRPWLTRVNAGETIQIPVYAGVRSRILKGASVSVCWTLSALDAYGNWHMDLDGGNVELDPPYLETGRSHIIVTMPQSMKAARLFAWMTDGSGTVCEHEIQFEITGEANTSPDAVLWNPARPDHETYSGFTGCLDQKGRHACWASGSGRLSYRVPVPEGSCGKKILRIELSSCECLEGTRLTDEETYPSGVRIFVDGQLCAGFLVPDHPFDRRALFSNSSACDGEELSYSRMGAYGYGYRYDIPVELTGDAEVVIEADHGCVIYGNRMGQYGCDPMFLDEKEA